VASVAASTPGQRHRLQRHPARHRYLIYGRHRKVSGYDYVQQVIADAGLRPGRSVFTVAGHLADILAAAPVGCDRRQRTVSHGSP
jgi:hypothetical protein